MFSKSKIMSIILIIMVAGLAVAGGQGEAPKAEITMVNCKIEVDAALKAYAQVYEKQTGVRVNVRSFGGEADYGTSLKALLNAGTEVEIFAISGKADYDEYIRSGRISNLSGEAWVKDTDVAYYDPNGQVVGFPLNVEGWGLGYNKALLQRAGIDPATLTNVGAIRAAFEKIDGMKAQLGIDAVVSMVAGSGMTWVTGLHGVNGYLALGLPYNNSTRYLDMLNNGQVDTPRLTKFAEYYSLLFRYSNRNTLLTGGYDQQVGEFAVGKTVFIHQGNWIDPTLEELGVKFDTGYIPHAFLDTNTDGIFVGPSWWYVVNPKSKNAEEAKKFLNAMASTPEGHDYMVNKAGMIAAFKSVKLTPKGPFSKAVQDWMSKGKIYAWQQNDMPAGFGMNTLGPIFSQLAAGQITTTQFVTLFTQAVASIKR